jgi:hypothetical protein
MSSSLINEKELEVELIVKGSRVIIIQKQKDNFNIKIKDVSIGREEVYRIEEDGIEIYKVSEDGFKIYFIKENSPYLYYQELNAQNIVSKVNILRPIEKTIIDDETSIALCLRKDIQISPDNKYIGYNICNTKAKLIILSLETARVVFTAKQSIGNDRMQFKWLDNNRVLLYDPKKQESNVIDLNKD